MPMQFLVVVAVVAAVAAVASCSEEGLEEMVMTNQMRMLLLLSLRCCFRVCSH